MDSSEGQVERRVLDLFPSPTLTLPHHRPLSHPFLGLLIAGELPAALLLAEPGLVQFKISNVAFAGESGWSTCVHTLPYKPQIESRTLSIHPLSQNRREKRASGLLRTARDAWGGESHPTGCLPVWGAPEPPCHTRHSEETRGSQRTKRHARHTRVRDLPVLRFC